MATAKISPMPPVSTEWELTGYTGTGQRFDFRRGPVPAIGPRPVYAAFAASENATPEDADAAVRAGMSAFRVTFTQIEAHSVSQRPSHRLGADPDSVFTFLAR